MSKQLRIWLFVLLGTLLTSTTLLAEGVITMTTSKKVGETILLKIEANGNVTIEGVKEPAYADGYEGFTLTSQIVTIRGDVTLLYCFSNQLTSLDVSKNTALRELGCNGNQLTSLDVSKNTALTELYCFSNQLTSLDVSKNTALTTLYCRINQLTSLNLSGCTALTELDCWGNQLTSLNVSGCTALTKLDCFSNQLTSLDLSGCTALTTLSCKHNPLTSINLSNCKSLEEFSCTDNKLTSLDVSGCTALTKLNCQNSQLTSLDVSSCTALSKLNCQNSQLTSLDVSKNTVLTELDCSNNQLTSLDVSKNSALTELNCSSNQLISLHLSSCRALTKVDCSSNQLTSLDLSDHQALTTLSCSDNLLRKIDLSNCPSIVSLTCDINQIKEGEMTNLVNSLPNLQGKGVGDFRVFNETREHEGNVCLSKHVATAKAKNWKTLFKRDYYGDIWYDYTGADKPTFAVTNELTRGGIVAITGASNLNSVVKGTELTVVATPAEGYELTALTANGVDILATKRFVVTKATVVKATFELITYSVKTSKLGEGTLNVSGADNLDAVMPDTELTIEATPAEGYELTALTANDKDILTSKKVVVNEDLIITATFTKKTFAVTLAKDGEGDLNATGADDLNAVPYGTELTIVATPTEGYELIALTAGEEDILATKKVVVTGNMTVKSIFAKKNFSVSLTKEGEGTITATGASNLNAVAYGTELTINATPAEGYELTALTANGTDILATKKVVVKEAVEVKATFAKKNFAVSLTKEGEGTITATGASDLNAVAYGTELTINATPVEGYELTALTANGTDILATKKVVVKEAVEVKATFTKKSFAVKLTKEGEGTITATGASNLNSVAYGTELTINATPAMGYELVSITANGADITASKKVVVTDNMTVKATFTKKNFAVSLTKVGEGTIAATGATSLNAVAYGTELTINATPAAGYELTALTANGTDILATKKVVIKGDTEVKATFTKKTFAVTLTSNEHGDITIVESVDLKAVPYGTTLTVKATGKNAQCVLTELTANGEDILASQSFVVTDVTEVKATFVDHTGVETTVTQETQLYPNPATDYVIVEGVAPASEVTLHSMTGERLYAGRADDRGTLQIDLTPYADGVYLVCVAGDTYRVVVRH